MRILTVRQPWAWAIVHGGKRRENRPCVWEYAGHVGVHAAVEWDLSAFDDPVLLAALESAGLSVDRVRAGLEGDWFPTSSVVGVARLEGGHRSGEGCCPGDPWARRPAAGSGWVAHHKLTGVRPLRDPIGGVRGNVMLWKPSAELEARIRAGVDRV